MEHQKSNLESKRRKLDKSTLPWVVLGLIIISIALFNLWLMFENKDESDSEKLIASVPEFTLTNQQRDEISLSDLSGKVWVADFIFTNCPTICPIMTKEMATLQSEFSSSDVNFVSFTVDPERDTSEVLANYAERYGADEKTWHFLTGEKDQIYQLANNGFKLAAAQHEGVFPHSRKFVLVAPNGDIYGYYDSHSEAAMTKLRKDMKTLHK